MRARDLVSDCRTVRLDTPAIEAARLLADEDLAGLVVVDDRGLPLTVLAGTQVLRLGVPAYIQDDPALARVVDEASADVFLRELRGVRSPSASPNSNVNFRSSHRMQPCWRSRP